MKILVRKDSKLDEYATYDITEESIHKYMDVIKALTITMPSSWLLTGSAALYMQGFSVGRRINDLDIIVSEDHYKHMLTKLKTWSDSKSPVLSNMVITEKNTSLLPLSNLAFKKSLGLVKRIVINANFTKKNIPGKIELFVLNKNKFSVNRASCFTCITNRTSAPNNIKKLFYPSNGMTLKYYPKYASAKDSYTIQLKNVVSILWIKSEMARLCEDEDYISKVIIDFNKILEQNLEKEIHNHKTFRKNQIILESVPTYVGVLYKQLAAFLLPF